MTTPPESVPAFLPPVVTAPPKTGIEKGLLEAQRQSSGVRKDSFNDYSKYAYASSDDVIAEARRALNVGGLTARCDAYDFRVDDRAQPWVELRIVLACPEAGESQDHFFPWPVILGEKQKPLDKAIATALTTAFAYWLRGLLALPRQDDDMNQRPDAGQSPANQVGKGKATPKQLDEILGHLERTGITGEKIAQDWGPSDRLTIETAGNLIAWLAKEPAKGKGAPPGK